MKKCLAKKIFASLLSASLVFGCFTGVEVFAESFAESYKNELSALANVENGTGVSELINEENALTYNTLYIEYNALTENEKSEIDGKYIDISAKIGAANIRADIFTKSTVTIDRVQDKNTFKYLTDNAKNSITAFKNVGAIPEFTYIVNYPDPSLQINRFENFFYAGYTKNDEELTAEAWVPDALAKLPDDGSTDVKGQFWLRSGNEGWPSFISTGDFIVGQYNGTEFSPYDIEVKIATYTANNGKIGLRTSIDNRHGFEKTNDCYDGFLVYMNESHFKNSFIPSFMKIEGTAVTSITVYFPEIASKIYSSAVENFMSANNNILNDVYNGKYNTPEKIATEINSDNAVQIENDVKAARTAFVELGNDESQAFIYNIVAERYNDTNLRAILKRTGIFTTAHFTLDHTTDADLLPYLADSDGSVTALKNVGAIPEFEYKINHSTEDSFLENLFYVDCTKEGSTYTANGWIADAKAKLPEDSSSNDVTANLWLRSNANGWNEIIITGEHTVGQYDGATFTPYDVTLKLSVICDKDGVPANLKAVVTDEFGFEKSNDYGKEFFTYISESQLKNTFIPAFMRNGKNNIAVVTAYYPDIAYLNNQEKIDEFMFANNNILNDVYNGKYDTAEKIVSEINSDNAVQIENDVKAARAAFVELGNDENQAFIYNIVAERYNDTNLRAILKRTGIFTTAHFTLDHTTDADLLPYLADSDGSVTALKNVGAIPEFEYKINHSTEDSFLENLFYVDCTKEGSTYTANGWIADAKAKLPEDSSSNDVTANLWLRSNANGWNEIIITGEHTVGQYDGATFTPYDVTLKLSVICDKDGVPANLKAVVTDEFGFEKSNDYGKEFFTYISESQLKNTFIPAFMRNGKNNIAVVTAYYPDIAYLNNQEKIDEFMFANNNILNDVYNGKYDTAEKIVSEINSDNAVQIENDVKAARAAFVELGNDENQAFIYNIVAERYNDTNLRAILKRTGIFTDKSFTYDRNNSDDVSLNKYLFTGDRIAVLRDVKGIPTVDLTMNFIEGAYGFKELIGDWQCPQWNTMASPDANGEYLITASGSAVGTENNFVRMSNHGYDSIFEFAKEPMKLGVYENSLLKSYDVHFVSTVLNNDGMFKRVYSLDNGNGDKRANTVINSYAPSALVSSMDIILHSHTMKVSVSYDFYENGDLNCDGEIGTSDLVLLRKNLLGISSAGDCYSDCNDNGTTDIIDLIHLKKELSK